MRFLLTPVGSSGDVHPFVGIGRELLARGHEVSLFSAEPHRQVVEQSGIEFVPTASGEQYHDATLNPDLWHPSRGFRTVLELVMPMLEPTHRALQARHRPGRTALVGHPLGFATRTFEEQTGVPAATIHLAPSSLRSVYQVPALPPGVDISGLPQLLKRGLWALIDRVGIDPLVTPTLNRWRGTLGLPPVRRVFKDWVNSPRLVIGLFPEWFGARQPDWPGQFQHASFPLWDDPDAPLDPELSAFLQGGTPPVVVFPGSANRHGRAFFAAAAAALQRLRRRGIFLTGYAEQLPPALPDSILQRSYAPFSAVLPRSAALVHHGGVGTMAQGFAAGLPQLIMPMAFDQPDNALRATRLGTARWLAPKRFTPERVTAALEELLDDPAVARATAEHQNRLRDVSGIRMACDMLERLT